MKTQSPDTSLDAELALIRMIRNAPLSKRFAFVQSWSASLVEAGAQYMHQLYPQANEEEMRLLFIEHQYGKDLTDELRQELHRHGIQLTSVPDYREVMYSLVHLFNDLAIPYALSGSLASSLYGLQRATLQLDFVADFHPQHLLSFCDQLEKRFLFHKEEVENALQQKTSFSLVHLASFLKVRIMFPETSAMGQHLFHQVRTVALTEDDPPFPLLSPEHMVLLLLVDYQQKNEQADDSWYDLQGILKVQGMSLDIPFLTEQALKLGVAELLERALIDAGIKDA